MALSPPILTAVDPSEQGETSIDPFATQAGYERLAERIYPHVTVQMARPRFITSIAVRTVAEPDLPSKLNLAIPVAMLL